MAKITRDDMRLIRYISREFGIDRHSNAILARAFIFSVGRIALKDFRRQDAIDPDFVTWDGRVFDIGGHRDGKVDGETKAIQRARYYCLRYGPMIRHVVDWLDVAVREQHAWLQNLDALRRPKKLMKSGSIKQLFDEAEKQLVRQHHKTISASRALTSQDIRWVCDLDFGLRLVQLLSPKALDDESGRMKHCVGLGGYDQKLTDPEVGIYSVRDGDGMALATIEVERCIVRQFYGPANSQPREDVAIAVGELMQSLGWMHWIEVYERDIEAYSEYHRLRRLLAMPFHAATMDRFRLLSDADKATEIANLRRAAGLGPDDPVPEPPVPAFVAADGYPDVTYTHIMVDENGEPQEVEVTADQFFRP